MRLAAGRPPRLCALLIRPPVTIGAISPIAIMPTALQWFARVNPLTYQTDILCALMLPGGHSTSGLPLDFAVLTGSPVILVAIAARLYPRVVL